MWNRIADLWCRTMHQDAMWPIHGKYVCRSCAREYPVVWEGPAFPGEYSHLPTEDGSVEIDSPVWLIHR